MPLFTCHPATRNNEADDWDLRCFFAQACSCACRASTRKGRVLFWTLLGMRRFFSCSERSSSYLFSASEFERSTVIVVKATDTHDAAPSDYCSGQYVCQEVCCEPKACCMYA